MKPTDTEVIDKLFLELSQVTKAKTSRDIAYEGTLWACYHVFNRLANGESKVEDVALKYKDEIYNILHVYK